MVFRQTKDVLAQCRRTTSSTPSTDIRDRVNVSQQRVLKQDKTLSTEWKKKLMIKRREADDVARTKPKSVQASIKKILTVLQQAGLGIYDEATGANLRLSYLGDRGYQSPPPSLEDGTHLDDDLDLVPGLNFSPGTAAIPHELYEKAQEEVHKFYEIKVWSDAPLGKNAYILADLNGHEYPFAISSTIISSKQVQQRTKAGLTPADDGVFQANIDAQPESALLNGCKDLAHIAVFDLNLIHDTVDGIRKQFSVVSNADREKSNKASVVITVHERLLVGKRPQVLYRFRGDCRRPELRDMDWAIKLGSEGWLHLNINGPRHKKDLLEVEPLPNGPVRAVGPGTEITVRVLACDEKKVNQHEFDQIARQDYNPDPIFVCIPAKRGQQSVLFVPAAPDNKDGGSSSPGIHRRPDGQDSFEHGDHQDEDGQDDDDDDEDNSFYNDQIANGDNDEEESHTNSIRSKKSSEKQLPRRRAIKQERNDDDYSVLFRNTLESLSCELESEQNNEDLSSLSNARLKRPTTSPLSTHEEDDDEIQFIGSGTSLARRPHSALSRHGSRPNISALPNIRSASILKQSLDLQRGKRIKVEEKDSSLRRTASPINRRPSSIRASQPRQSSAALQRLRDNSTARSSPMFIPETRGMSRSPFTGPGRRLGG